MIENFFDGAWRAGWSHVTVFILFLKKNKIKKEVELDINNDKIGNSDQKKTEH